MDVVNGYICTNCTDVAYAKRNIDPAHPGDGVQGPSTRRRAPGVAEAAGTPPYLLGGTLTGLNLGSAVGAPSALSAAPAGGLDVLA